MAALPLRDASDCAVIGDGWAARLIAQAMASSGFSTVLITGEPRPVDAWLHPRLRQETAQELPRLLPLRGIIVHDAAGECVEILRPNLSERTPSELTRPGLNLRRAATYQGNARFVVHVSGVTTPRCAVGGIYRHLTMAPGEEQFGHMFQTRLPGVVAWLASCNQASCGSGLFSLGIIRTSRQVTQSEPALAELFEEALVACPALTARLVHAQLVGGLHTSNRARTGDFAAIPGAISLPAFDAEVDPLFASGYELAGRCAHELVSRFDSNLDCAPTASQRTAAWQRQWPETEQGVRNLVHYYYSCPPGRDRCPGDSRHLLRESSADFA